VGPELVARLWALKAEESASEEQVRYWLRHHRESVAAAAATARSGRRAAHDDGVAHGVGGDSTVSNSVATARLFDI
jgi:hypothetical protein